MNPTFLLSAIFATLFGLTACDAQAPKQVGSNPLGEKPKEISSSVQEKGTEGAVVAHRKMITELRTTKFSGSLDVLSERIPDMGRSDALQLGWFANHIQACADFHDIVAATSKKLPETELKAYEYLNDISKPLESVNWPAKKPKDGVVIISDMVFGAEYRYQLIDGRWQLDLKDWFSQPAYRKNFPAWGKIIRNKTIVIQRIEEGRFNTLKEIMEFIASQN